MTLWRVGLAAAQMAAVPILLCTDLLVGTARWAALAAVFVALAVANRLRARLTRRIAALNPAHDFEAIYKLLGCYEFPWEIFYGINFAFFRTFSSPTISGLYYNTGTIEKTTGKRVNDTDILMHAWFDFGIDSAEGRASWQHLNRIHGHFAGKHKNVDFVYVLCCFIADTIRFVNIFGWRQLSADEEEAIYRFWIRVGERMNLKEMPTSLRDALQLVEDYVESDKTSRDTKGGRALTEACTRLIVSWYWFLPAPLVRFAVPALLYVIGGATFVRKLGLPTPARWLRGLLYGAGYVRGVFMSFVLPRTRPHQLSKQLMIQDYDRKFTCPMQFGHVGPTNVISTFQSLAG